MNRLSLPLCAKFLVVCLAAALCNRAAGLPTFYSGSFVQDNDKALIPFNWPGGTAYIQSLGFSGGVNSLGDSVAGGGFDPILSLFDSAGTLINLNDDFRTQDPYLAQLLPPGDYTAVVTQWDNYPNGPTLDDGFFRDAQPNFAGGYYGLQPTWAIDFPAASPWTIARAKAVGIGPTVYIEGAVVTNVVDLINSSASASFQIQDATGALTVFGSNALINDSLAGISEGDAVALAGTFTLFSGLLEVTPQFVIPLESPGVPAATVVSTSDLQDGNPLAESLESSLVQLSNVYFVGVGPGQTFAALTNYVVSDGIANAVVRVSTGQLNMVGQPIPTGRLNLRGVLSQFDSTAPLNGGYQLLLTRSSDIRPVPEPASGVAALGLFACGMSARRSLRCR